MTLTLPSRETWGEGLHRAYRVQGDVVNARELFIRDLTRRNKRRLTVVKWGKILLDFGRYLERTGFQGGLLNVSREHIEGWLDAKGELAPSTRAAYITCLNSFYKFLLNEEIIVGRNPCEKVARPTVRRGLPRPIGETDLAAAIKYAQPRMRCFLMLGAFAGLRCCEISGLDVADIIWSDGPSRPGALRITAESAKGGRERMVPLHPLIEQALRAYGVPKEGPFFRNSRNNRINAWQVSHLGSEYLRSAGIPHTMHSLRHRFASEVYRKGGILATQQLLGHASPTTTAIYAKVAMEDLWGAVASLEDPTARRS